MTVLTLLRHYQALKEQGEPIPRTVIIAPTSKMRKFEILLDVYGLADDADVVSRQEATQVEIEAARVSDKPILISSPVFALGLNFNCVPVRFWTYYEYLDVDTSQIIQTLNRANRTATPCEVRLYPTGLDPVPATIPVELVRRMKIEEYFIGESDLHGVLDSHFQVDRVTYMQLRDCEKSTGKSLYQLKINDAIQNYHIVEDWDETMADQAVPIKGTKEDGEDFKNAKWAAKDSYDEDVLQYVPGYSGEPTGLLLHELQQLKPDKRRYPTADSLAKDGNDKSKAIAMALTQTSNVGVGAKIKTIRLRRLFGDALVFLSAQYDWKTSPEWMKVASQKTQELSLALGLLNDLRSGELDGVSFGKKMRLKGNRRGVIALADNENDYVLWNEKLELLDSLHEEYSSRASENRKESIDYEFFAVAKDFLATIGVYFGKTKCSDGRERVDPAKPIVPDWDYDEMARVLLVKAESLKHLPVKPIDTDLVEYRWCGGVMDCAVCKTCVHFDPFWSCRLGRPVECEILCREPDTNDCDAIKRLPVKLRQKEEGEPRIF